MQKRALVLSLGNPGSRYLFTRHNAGHICLDFIRMELKFDWDNGSRISKKCFCESAVRSWADAEVLFLKANTYMNESGKVLSALSKYFPKWKVSKDLPLIVLHDELDVPAGKAKVKFGGSDAGHNGLRSIRQHIGHGDYFRIRVGIGRPPKGSPIDISDYVLQKFAKEDEAKLEKTLQKSLHMCHELIFNNLESAQAVAAKK